MTRELSGAPVAYTAPANGGVTIVPCARETKTCRNRKREAIFVPVTYAQGTMVTKVL